MPLTLTSGAFRKASNFMKLLARPLERAMFQHEGGGGVPEDVIRCVLSHADHTGVGREALRDRVLYACDELTGLITAVTLVRPSKSLYDLKVKSLKKKWKDKSFAAGVSRSDIERGADELGIELWDHVRNVIDSMCWIAPDLGLDGMA